MVLFFAMAPDLPDADALFAESRQAKVTVLAADRSVIAVRGSHRRPLRPAGRDLALAGAGRARDRGSALPPPFRHRSVGLGRAALDNLRAGAVVAGGSTITQQLAKNLYLTPERSLTRKLQELTLAIWLETRLDKDQILALYLNRVYLGAGAYGVEAASRRYFGKPAARRDPGRGGDAGRPAQGALRAGADQRPRPCPPARGVVLGAMQEEGYITAAEATAARLKPARLAPETEEVGAWFVDWVLDGLTEHLGKPERDLVVYTTLDRKLQAGAEAALAASLARAGSKSRVGEGAVVVLDTTGAVRAMVGGRDHRTSPFNRAVNAHRQPGSAFKPFVYLAALEAGWLPGNTIDDRPAADQGLAAGQFRRQVPWGRSRWTRRSRIRSTPPRSASPRRWAPRRWPPPRASSASSRRCSRCPRSRSAPRR